MSPKSKEIVAGGATGVVDTINLGNDKGIEGPFGVRTEDKYAITVTFWFPTKKAARKWLTRHKHKEANAASHTQIGQAEFVLYRNVGRPESPSYFTEDFFRTERGAKQAARARKLKHFLIRKEVLIAPGKWRIAKKGE